MKNQLDDLVNETVTEIVTKKNIADKKNQSRKNIFIKFFKELKNDNVLDIILDLLKTDDGYEQIRKEMVSLTTLYNEADITDDELEDTNNKVSEFVRTNIKELINV